MENFENDLKNRIKAEAGDVEKHINRHYTGRLFWGVVLVVTGGVLLARQFGVEFPEWLFTWKTFLILVGLFIGVRHSFRGIAWMVPIVIGTVFLMQEFIPDISFGQYIWPILIICFGLFMLFRPRPRQRARNWEFTERIDSDEFVDATSIFGGTKRTVITKNFKGGDITTIFGGCELDLTQADFNGTAVLDVTQIFGGAKLLIPSNWNIKSDVVCVFGGIDDKRQQVKDIPDNAKMLHLTGSCIFGGIEIKSF